ncbi:MAG: formylglycine-generating enzyme family protein [Micropruina sp.]|uniref:formylglycine-generating enzyme family protein n=1 Tax=Micropruina sp. TaxID=2737536 RepID=UPI0039E29405
MSLPEPYPSRPIDDPVPAGMAWIDGGVFQMGSDRFYPEEAPVHRVRVDGFWMDRAPVTNADFARFVDATGYVTVAERSPDPSLYPGADPAMLVAGSLVFQAPRRLEDMRFWGDWWHYVPGASWRRPDGVDGVEGRLEDHPVVHICHADAEAYAAWAGKSLPTEAEWEYAARGGLDGADYSWGSEFAPQGQRLANIWDGPFPMPSEGRKPAGTSAIGTYPANAYGLLDMIGNVWEWTTDFWTGRHRDQAAKPCCIPLNPRETDAEASYDPDQSDIRIARRVLKGGSHLCAPNYCRRYRPAARQPQMEDSATSHLGFRCVIRPDHGRDTNV